MRTALFITNDENLKNRIQIMVHDEAAQFFYAAAIDEAVGILLYPGKAQGAVYLIKTGGLGNAEAQHLQPHHHVPGSTLLIKGCGDGSRTGTANAFDLTQTHGFLFKNMQRIHAESSHDPLCRHLSHTLDEAAGQIGLQRPQRGRGQRGTDGRIPGVRDNRLPEGLLLRDDRGEARRLR